MLKNKNIILGVTGGIAIYKSLDLISRLVKEGANVEVIMTEGAKEFINPLTFQTMSNNPVHHKMFGEIEKFDVEHISLAKKADIILVAPATANTIGKIANGIADNLLTTVIMATKAKVAFAPAMNTGMYTNPIYKENMKKLQKLGYYFIEPGEGRLACGDYGSGKMSEPIDILNELKYILSKKDLYNKNVLVTAGPTIEKIDPVRYLTNHSSGKMGYAIAEEANNRGANVFLISGPTNLKVRKNIKLLNVESTEDMFNMFEKYYIKADIVIKAAAPADYKPKKYFEEKIKKMENSEKVIELEKNPDILKYFSKLKKKNQVFIGFAAETTNLEEYALKKLKEKRLDMIVANNISDKDAGFKSDTNKVIIFKNNNEKFSYPIMDKKEIAKIILDESMLILKNKS